MKLKWVDHDCDDGAYWLEDLPDPLAVWCAEATFAKALPDLILNMIIEHAMELMWVEVRTAASIERITVMLEAFQNSKVSNFQNAAWLMLSNMLLAYLLVSGTTSG